MRKVWILALCLCLLTACAPSGPDAGKVAGYYAGLSQIAAEATITVNSGLLCTYRVAYQRSGGEATVTIIEPETLAGLSATLNTGGAAIRYEDAAVEMMLPSLPGFVPIDALDGAIEDLIASVPASVSASKLEERPIVSLSYVGETEGYALEKIIRCDAGSMAILTAEFYLNGAQVMQLSVDSFIAG